MVRAFSKEAEKYFVGQFLPPKMGGVFLKCRLINNSRSGKYLRLFDELLPVPAAQLVSHASSNKLTKLTRGDT
jgi:hypothetical protein